MSFFHLIEILVLFAFLLCLTPLLGRYMYKTFTAERPPAYFLLGWLENLCYWISGINPREEMTWKTYAKTLIAFNFLGFFAVFFLQLFQQYLPLNPQNLPATSWDLAFNTAASFMTNTNWQSYSGESTLSYLTQMLGLTVQNFLSAATGLAVLLALIRGLTRKTSETIGNFWFDLVRSVVYLFLPLSIIFAIFLAGEGVIQSISPYVEVTTLENAKQTIPLGPVASQEAIKILGTNGGGFFSANSAHPFENPTYLTNFFQTLGLLLIPAASVYMYGIMINSKRHGWLLLFAMAVLWIGGLIIALYSEHLSNPVLDAYPLFEGKESRFGISNSILWSITTTASANGSVNAMISSHSPIAGGIALFNIMIGELAFGGIGVGLCAMIKFALLTVFISGLMVGRTPEYQGKKIEVGEMQWAMLAILSPAVLILTGAGISSILPTALSSLGNQGPHGLTEILYAFSSAAGNNGSAFAGLNSNTDYYNISLGITMILGRLSIIIPSLGLAGHLAKKKITPLSVGTFSTNTGLFFILLIFIIIIQGALTFFPAFSLGPIAEQLLMMKGRTF